MPALLDRGRTAIRDSLKTLISHVGVSTDNTAFAAGQTVLDPSGTGTNAIKASTETDVDAFTFDATMTLTDADFAGTTTLWTISAMNGATRTDPLSRTVRTAGIGVQAGDSYTIGVRVQVQDNSP